MIKFFKYAVVAVVLVSSYWFTACTDEESEIGSGIIGSDSRGNLWTSNLLVQNLFFDSLRSDENVLQTAVLGSYSDNTLGSVTAKYITQVRVNLAASPLIPLYQSLDDSLNFQYTVDSVILRIPVVFNTNNSGDDTDNIERIDTVFLYEEVDSIDTDTDTLQITTTYKLDSIYGEINRNMTLRVREVEEFLFNRDTIYYSNPTLRERDEITVASTELGSASVGGELQTVVIRATNASNDIFSESASYKVFLDNDYFKTLIVDDYESQSLVDQSAFIRQVMQGIQIEVDPTNGFLFSFNSTNASFNTVIYSNYSYTRANPTQEQIDDNDLTVEGNTAITLDLSNVNNVKINQFDNDYTGTTYINDYQNDENIYLAGLSGIRSEVQVPQANINALRDSVQQRNWAIIDARLKVYVNDQFNYPLPQYLYAWHVYEDENGETQEVLFDDLTAFVNTYPFNVQFNPLYNFEEDNGYYEIHITETLKNIVEGEGAQYNNSRIMLTMGNFLLQGGVTGIPVSNNPFFNNRAMNPYRLVLKGNDGSSEQISLEVRYVN